MNIGNLYLVKKYFWLLFPTKDAVAAEDARWIHRALNAADYWSRQLNCEVTCFSPDSIVVFLEEDGNYKKVLTSDGKIGWTWFDESYNECFEEVNP